GVQTWLFRSHRCQRPALGPCAHRPVCAGHGAGRGVAGPARARLTPDRSAAGRHPLAQPRQTRPRTADPAQSDRAEDALPRVRSCAARTVHELDLPVDGGHRGPARLCGVPVQLNEMWRFHPQVLPHYAKHIDTGEPMPAELVAALVDSERVGHGFDTFEYLAAAMLDLSWHSLEAGEHITDVLSFESEVLSAAGFSPLVPPRYRTTYFGHIFASGYAAGYYSYLYSEVIAAWVSEWF